MVIAAPAWDDDPAAYAALGMLYALRTLSGLATSERRGWELICAVRTGTYRIIRNPGGEPVGYVAWANIGRDIYLHLREGGPMPRYMHEWQEGPLALVLDVVIAPEWRGAMVRDLFALRSQAPGIVVVRSSRVRRYGRRAAAPMPR